MIFEKVSHNVTSCPFCDLIQRWLVNFHLVSWPRSTLQYSCKKAIGISSIKTTLLMHSQGISCDCSCGNKTRTGRAIFRPSFLSTEQHYYPQFISEFLPKDTIENAINTMV